MSTWIALLRGVGGGIRPLSMRELSVALEGIGLRDVRTYIQTGNVVFSSRKAAARLAGEIERCIEKTFGFHSRTFVLGRAHEQPEKIRLGHEADDVRFGVNYRQTSDVVLQHETRRRRERRIRARGHGTAVHHFPYFDRRIQISRGCEQQIAFGGDADDPPVRIHDRQVMHGVLLHEA